MRACPFDPVPHCEEIYSAVSSATGIDLSERIDLGIFASRKDLKRYLDDRRFGSLWANGAVGGAAMPSFGEIAMWAGSNPERFRTILAHELTHYLLAETGLATANWKSEAVAYAAGWLLSGGPPPPESKLAMEQWWPAVRDNRLVHEGEETAAWTHFVAWLRSTGRIATLKELVPLLVRMQDEAVRRDLEQVYR